MAWNNKQQLFALELSIRASGLAMLNVQKTTFWNSFEPKKKERQGQFAYK